jgi:hypothetical protein
VAVQDAARHRQPVRLQFPALFRLGPARRQRLRLRAEARLQVQGLARAVGLPSI